MESYLQIDSLVKTYGDHVLLDGFTLNVSEGEKIGLIARNGMGKSTLLDIIAGKEDYNSGTIVFRKDLKVSYLEQNPAWPKGTLVIDACGGRSDEVAARGMLTKLGITDYYGTIDNMSGGQLKRVAIAAALISKPDFLILDEPTNHLDVEVTEWLERYLSSNRLTLLLVTHDRYLLDRVCTRIVELEDHRAYSYDGSYSYYLEKRQERLDAEAAQRLSDENLYRRELEWMRRMPSARGTKARYRKESFHDLEERLRFCRNEQQVKLDVKASYIGNKIFEMHGVGKRFGDKLILDGFDYTFARYEKLGIVGANGVGKSTFLKLVTGDVQPDSGVIERGATLRIGYYSQQGMEFNPGDKVIDAVTAIADHLVLDDGRHIPASQFLQKFLFPPKVQHSYISRLSGGERRRLYLCTILMRNPNFLILDEPTNDLDIATLQVLEEYIAGFKGCVVAVSHDRCFMDKVAGHLFVFEGDGRITDFPSSYSDWLEWKELKKLQETQPAVRERTSQQSRNVTRKTNPNKLTFKEKREMEQIEAELQQLEAERASLEAELNTGSLAYDVLAAKSTRVGQVISRIDEITMRWLELSEKD